MLTDYPDADSPAACARVYAHQAELLAISRAEGIFENLPLPYLQALSQAYLRIRAAEAVPPTDARALAATLDAMAHDSSLAFTFPLSVHCARIIVLLDAVRRDRNAAAGRALPFPAHDSGDMLYLMRPGAWRGRRRARARNRTGTGRARARAHVARHVDCARVFTP